jgi:hypothetical protein
MSSTKFSADVNAILDPVLFQVVGSTPESIVDNIKKAQLKGKSGVATRLFAISIFAAAVNKKTLETFLEKPELMDLRATMATSFNIQGRTNMTGLTLLGHCLLTTGLAGEVVFAKEFRRKMGQDHLWDGELDSGSLGETQKKILKEKKRLTNSSSARLLGSGFLKYTGMSADRMSAAESEFWSEQGSNPVSVSAPISTLQPQSQPTRAQQPAPPSPPSKSVASTSRTAPAPQPAQKTPPRQAKTRVVPKANEEEMTNVTLSDGSIVAAPKRIVDYYLLMRDGDMTRLVASIENNGINNFVEIYGMAEENDPDRRGNFGGSVAG